MAVGRAREEISLNGCWQLRDEAIAVQADEHLRVVAEAAWIDAPVPGAVHQALIADGRMQEPLLGLNSLECEWVEQRSWWYRKSFYLTSEQLSADGIELFLDGLDVKASIFVNGRAVGEHPSAYRPFVARVEKFLHEGENTLLIRLTHGTEGITEEFVRGDLGGILNFRNTDGRGEMARPYVRKPAYTWGWDWSPRLATVGIGGECKLVLMRKTVIRYARVRSERLGKDVQLNVTVEAYRPNYVVSDEGRVSVKVYDPQGKLAAEAAVDCLLQNGTNYVPLTLKVSNAQLWWPRGLGRQDRYRIVAEVVSSRHRDRRELLYGIRFVELQSHKTFRFLINGKVVFCKGGNWIPADALYLRVTDERVDALVRLAVEENHNMLRVWGGGLYEREAFYEACDREGVLVWQDFMLACSTYPDHRESFRDELAKEAQYQTRRLAHRACVVVWVGSNECYGNQAIGRPNETDQVTRLMGEVLPQAVQANCPQTPYWYCSPGGGKDECDYTVGDAHHWLFMMHKEMEPRITPERFDSLGGLLFMSEFGYPGPPSEVTIRQYLNGAPFERTDATWQHHNNAWEKHTVDAGITRHYVDAAGLSPGQYVLYGGLTQGLMLGYALESCRFIDTCHGGLYWMFNDAWGEIGWTTVDYYLRRKICWYFVKRAFAPQRLILRKTGSRIVVCLANDTAEPVRGVLEYGYVSLDGQRRQAKTVRIAGKPLARTELVAFAAGGQDATQGVWYALVRNNADILPATLKAAEPKELLTEPTISWSLHSVAKAGLTRKAADGSSSRDAAHRYAVTISSDQYARAVEIALPDGVLPEDNYFALLPGESRTIAVRSPARLAAQDVHVRCV